MGRRKRRGKRRKPGMKRTVLSALACEVDVRDLAQDHGLAVRISAVRCSGGKVETHHWMFDDDKGRVLNYWPGTGRFYSPRNGEKGRAVDALAALDAAARISVLAWTGVDR